MESIGHFFTVFFPRIWKKCIKITNGFDIRNTHFVTNGFSAKDVSGIPTGGWTDTGLTFICTWTRRCVYLIFRRFLRYFFLPIPLSTRHSAVWGTRISATAAAYVHRNTISSNERVLFSPPPPLWFTRDSAHAVKCSSFRVRMYRRTAPPSAARAAATSSTTRERRCGSAFENRRIAVPFISLGPR